MGSAALVRSAAHTAAARERTAATQRRPRGGPTAAVHPTKAVADLGVAPREKGAAAERAAAIPVNLVANAKAAAPLGTIAEPSLDLRSARRFRRFSRIVFISGA